MEKKRNGVWRFWYKAAPDGMPQYVYIVAPVYKAAWEAFKNFLSELSGFNPFGPLRYYDASRFSEEDYLGSTLSPCCVAGSGELGFLEGFLWA